MEGQGDHGLHLVQLYGDHAVVVCAVSRGHLPVAVPAAQQGQSGFGLLIGLPHGGQAGGLGGHDINARPVVHGQTGHAGAKELHDGVLHRAVFKGGAHQGQSHILGSHAGPGRTGEVDGNHLGIGNVISFFQQLAGQLRAALANSHAAVSPVAGVGVGAQQHPAGSGVALPHVGVDHGLVRRNELAAILFGGGQAENVVVLVDGAAHGAQGVVAVGEHIGQREFLHAGGTGGLDDAHVSDIVGRHGVEADGQAVGVIRCVVAGEDGVGHGALPAFLGRSGDKLAVLPAGGAVADRNHVYLPPSGAICFNLV